MSTHTPELLEVGLLVLLVQERGDGHFVVGRFAFDASGVVQLAQVLRGVAEFRAAQAYESPTF